MDISFHAVDLKYMIKEAQNNIELKTKDISKSADSSKLLRLFSAFLGPRQPTMVSINLDEYRVILRWLSI